MSRICTSAWLRDQEPQLIETIKQEKRKLKNASDAARCTLHAEKLESYDSSRDNVFDEILFLPCLNVSNDVIAISDNSINIRIKLSSHFM